MRPEDLDANSYQYDPAENFSTLTQHWADKATDHHSEGGHDKRGATDSQCGSDDVYLQKRQTDANRHRIEAGRDSRRD